MTADSLDSLIVDDLERGLFRVHRSTMTSQAIYALERERIFDRCWLYVGHESEIPAPGDFVRRSVGGRPIVFVRGADGEVRALFNSCTHRGATICRQDSGNTRIFQCFYHAWTFDTKGDLVQVPDEAGYSECFDRAERALRAPARFDHYRGLYFLNYDAEAEELSDYLADAKEFIDLILFDPCPEGFRVIPGSNLYAMKANWKLLSENSMDGYHGVPLHSTFLDFIKSYGEGGEIPANAREYACDLGNGHNAFEYPSPQPRPVALWHPLFGEEARAEIAAIEQEVVDRLGPERAARVCKHGKHVLIFPNLVIGDGPGAFIRTFWPVAPNYMEIAQWAVAGTQETQEQVERRVNMFVTFLGAGGMASPDDVEALESCQEAFATVRDLEWSDISRGMHRGNSMFDELQMRTFWRAWLARMQGREPGRVVGSELDPAGAVPVPGSA